MISCNVLVIYFFFTQMVHENETQTLKIIFFLFLKSNFLF